LGPVRRGPGRSGVADGITAQDIAPSGVWESITGLAFAPDGRILVIEKRGVVHIVEHGLKRPEPFP
jgi:hypothetical protein